MLFLGRMFALIFYKILIYFLTKEILKNFLFKTDILERIAENKYSESIVRNLIRGLEYSNQKKVDSPKVQR